MFIEMLVQRSPPRVKQISLQGWMTLCLNVQLCQYQFLTSFCKERKRSHRSCSISLFCRFHCSLKSVENSCQTEKKVLSETSFSPDFGLTEKDTVRSKKLRRGNKKVVRMEGWRCESFWNLFTWPHIESTNVTGGRMHLFCTLRSFSHLKHKPVMV